MRVCILECMYVLYASMYVTSSYTYVTSSHMSHHHVFLNVCMFCMHLCMHVCMSVCMHLCTYLASHLFFVFVFLLFVAPGPARTHAAAGRARFRGGVGQMPDLQVAVDKSSFCFCTEMLTRNTHVYIEMLTRKTHV